MARTPLPCNDGRRRTVPQPAKNEIGETTAIDLETDMQNRPTSALGPYGHESSRCAIVNAEKDTQHVDRGDYCTVDLRQPFLFAFGGERAAKEGCRLAAFFTLNSFFACFLSLRENTVCAVLRRLSVLPRQKQHAQNGTYLALLLLLVKRAFRCWLSRKQWF